MTKFEKYLVWGSTAAVAATGIAYAGIKYLLQPDDPFAIVNSPWQPILLKAHIVSAPVMLFALGTIALRHIWPHFRKGLVRGRRSGVSSMLLLIPMIGTGYALQVFTSESWLRWLGYIHLALGLVFSVGAIVHSIATRSAPRILRTQASERGYGDEGDMAMTSARSGQR